MDQIYRRIDGLLDCIDQILGKRALGGFREHRDHTIGIYGMKDVIMVFMHVHLLI